MESVESLRMDVKVGGLNCEESVTLRWSDKGVMGKILGNKRDK